MALGIHQRDEEIFSHELYENTPKCARMKLFIRFNTISSSFYARNSRLDISVLCKALFLNSKIKIVFSHFFL